MHLPATSRELELIMKVLLVAPNIRQNKMSYGGGIGGVSRNLNLFLDEFSKEGITIKPSYHSVRKKNELKIISFPKRLIIDCFVLIKNIKRYDPDIVHLFGQYRKALLREFAFCIICMLLEKKYIYHIRAGRFIEENKNFFHRILSTFILNRSAHILCEGEKYIEYLSESSISNSTFFPNFVSKREIPPKRTHWFHNPLKILFVGYCFNDKGTYELVEAVRSLADTEQVIELYLVGEEEEEFSKWLNNFLVGRNLTIHRLGQKEHDEVMSLMRECDLYCYPSKYSGEGHNNSINEAMMNEMIIVSSKAGFLKDILYNSAYLLEEVSKKEIIKKISLAINDKEKSIRMAQFGRHKIIESYNSDVAFSILRNVYFKSINKNEASYTAS
ncbi:MAG: glycosyltransferase family 4 protein [Balneolales bacterium]